VADPSEREPLRLGTCVARSFAFAVQRCACLTTKEGTVADASAVRQWEVVNLLDDDGNPAGGHVVGTGIFIEWQNGPLGRGPDRQEPNGAFVENVLKACIERVRFYNETRFRCRENSLAITHMEEALHWMQARTADREVRGVEGTHVE
jgi:hypothetical protein